MENKELLPACCYCGREATTREHVPPKAIFTKPLPSDLITIPCCIKCNTDGSVNDEYFKTYLGMHVAYRGGEAERLYKERTLTTTRHNTKLRQTIIRSMRPVHLATESGIIYGTGAEVLWDSNVHDKAIDRIARGLFYHHCKRPLLNIAESKVYWHDSPLAFNMLAVDCYDSNSVGNGAFMYHYGITDYGSGSVWAFSFYNAHFASAILTTEDFGYDETEEP